MQTAEIKFDCRYFRGDIPCLPNKLRAKVCSSCDEYTPTKTRILIIKLGAIGDVIRSTPLLQRFREVYPDAHISWLTLTPEVVPASRVDKIYKLDFKSLFVLRQLPFDIVVNLDKDFEACALLNEISASQKYGFSLQDGHLAALNTAAKHKLLTGAFDSISKQNTKSYLEEIFAICDFDFRNEPYVLDVDPAFEQKWHQLHEMAAGRKIIGLNTGCGTRWLTRLWPQTHWIALMKHLRAANYFPLLLGGPAEDIRNRAYAEETGTLYLGTFPLPEFISLTAQCAVIVTAVTMMMHISIALAVPLVLFNNIFNPNEFELYGSGIMLQPESGCDCYYANTCRRERHCMLDIPEAAVFKAIEKLAAKYR